MSLKAPVPLHSPRHCRSAIASPVIGSPSSNPAAISTAPSSPKCWRRRTPTKAVVLVLGDFVGDDEALDVAGALVDLADPHIAVDALDRETGDIAVAAMDLDRVGGDPLGHLGGEELGHRRLLDAGLRHRAAPRLRARGRAPRRFGSPYR